MALKDHTTKTITVIRDSEVPVAISSNTSNEAPMEAMALAVAKEAITSINSKWEAVDHSNRTNNSI